MRALGMITATITLLGGLWSAAVHAEWALHTGEQWQLAVAALSSTVALVGFGVLDRIFFRED